MSLARKLLSIVNESTYDPPANWDKGFQYPYRIGGGGSERPYLKNGEWKLRVWNAQDKKHYIYDFKTDMFELDETGPWCGKATKTESVIVGDDMPVGEVQRVYNEIGDVSDTEILCGIRKLKVSDNGRVLSYVTESRYTEKQMTNAWNYANTLKNSAKREYALRCVDHAKSTGSDDFTNVEIPQGLSYLAAQAVRLSMRDALSGKHAFGKQWSPFIDEAIRGESWDAGQRVVRHQCKSCGHLWMGPKSEHECPKCQASEYGESIEFWSNPLNEGLDQDIATLINRLEVVRDELEDFTYDQVKAAERRMSLQGRNYRPKYRLDQLVFDKMNLEFRLKKLQAEKLAKDGPPNGWLKWGEKKLVATHQHAWTDETVYKVPVQGTINTSAIWSALANKLNRPSLGKFGGGISVGGVVDNGDGTVNVSISYSIGD